MHPEILSIALFWFVAAFTPGPNNVVASYSGFNFGITGNQIDLGYKLAKRDGLYLVGNETLHSFNLGISIGDLWFVKRREI